MRGYAEEWTDFVDAAASGREPLSGGDLARETLEVIYAGYLSAATGRRVDLPGRRMSDRGGASVAPPPGPPHPWIGGARRGVRAAAHRRWRPSL